MDLGLSCLVPLFFYFCVFFFFFFFFSRNVLRLFGNRAITFFISLLLHVFVTLDITPKLYNSSVNRTNKPRSLQHGHFSLKWTKWWRHWPRVVALLRPRPTNGRGMGATTSLHTLLIEWLLGSRREIFFFRILLMSFVTRFLVSLPSNIVFHQTNRIMIFLLNLATSRQIHWHCAQTFVTSSSRCVLHVFTWSNSNFYHHIP